MSDETQATMRQFDRLNDEVADLRNRLDQALGVVAAVKAELSGAVEDIRSRRRQFAQLGADEKYLEGLDDAFSLASNRRSAVLASVSGAVEGAGVELVHWVGDAPTSLHGNGAGSFTRTSRDLRQVTCHLCQTLLAREDPPVAEHEQEVRAEDERQYARLTPASGNGPWHIVKSADRHGYPMWAACGVDLEVGPGAIEVRLEKRILKPDLVERGRKCRRCFAARTPEAGS